MVHRRDHPCRGEDDNILDIPCNMEVLGPKVRCDASDLSVNDSYIQLHAVKRCSYFETQV